MKQPIFEEVTLEKIVGGGQALGVLKDGRKVFVWGGLPGETVEVMVTKKKSSYAEAVVTKVIAASPERVEPIDPSSYLSTSPWQIMSFDVEQTHKAALIAEAFELHHIKLEAIPTMYSDDRQLGYRNKVEFSWWWDNDGNTLDLAFFRRGSHGKIPVEGTSLARPEINTLALQIRDLLRTKPVEARSLKTLLIRCDQSGKCVWQLYVKDKLPDLIQGSEADALAAEGGEIIYSDPKSPASKITERLTAFGNISLSDTIRGLPFRYAAESFFQVNIPVYERALEDIQSYITDLPVIDLYSGVGSIGLSVTSNKLTLVEINDEAYTEMIQNVRALQREATVEALLAPAEKSLDAISSEAILIVDPPRAGLHSAVVDKILEALPPKILYLSCNPVTQARDYALLSEKYEITYMQGYNFFPRTPHIEHLIVLELPN